MNTKKKKKVTRSSKKNHSILHAFIEFGFEDDPKPLGLGGKPNYIWDQGPLYHYIKAYGMLNSSVVVETCIYRKPDCLS